ncbi:hypothetical protein AVEN_92500-1 [Araneus ventricosus]|uniref:Uncharacterized protein n=1 Tax=Araneus ventricosus TaxID=182803 RepID=A0A4Y2AJ62_ARAVE|nr:hypothetical protein AVEN_92500-1 [Araneus ventricosus]
MTFSLSFHTLHPKTDARGRVTFYYLLRGGYAKEEYEEWMSIDEDIPIAATLTNLEICQAICKQDQSLKVDDSDGDECVEENPPTNAEMRHALDILKLGVKHRSTNFKKQYEYEQYK